MSLKKVNELMEEYYDDFKGYCEEHEDELYAVSLFKQEPLTLTLPNIQIQYTATPYAENLSKEEPQWQLNFEVEIYAQDISRITRREVAKKLQEIVFEKFFEEYGFNCIYNEAIPNIDAKIHRILMRFEGIVDVDRNILFRN